MYFFFLLTSSKTCNNVYKSSATYLFTGPIIDTAKRTARK